ncbi:hypothetical protein DPMN_015509 [Dreissena polymorpha]|uniref:Uncharacterized protein n=1 Tax=Dreissena polymorpha TaxID=45954 RepID=A0A9D4NCY2_DREPO|nr:hypothetical protein DPMN_015509 [Dreissena polymorpha]
MTISIPMVINSIPSVSLWSCFTADYDHPYTLWSCLTADYDRRTMTISIPSGHSNSIPSGHVLQRTMTISIPHGHVLQRTMTISIPSGHVFQRTMTISIPISLRAWKAQNINRTNVLTKFMKSDQDFEQTKTIFELVQDIIKTDVLTKFHSQNAPPSGGHVFQATGTIFELVQYIIGTNRNIIRTNVLNKKNAKTPGSHFLQPTHTIFKLVQDIIGTNLLTKFHEHLTITVASRVLTRKNAKRSQKMGLKAFGRYDTQTDRLTDRQSANHKSPPVKPFEDSRSKHTKVIP